MPWFLTNLEARSVFIMRMIMVVIIRSLYFYNLSLSLVLVDYSWFRYAKEMEAWELARLQKDDRFGIGLLICLIENDWELQLNSFLAFLICLIENGFVGAHCIICQTTFNGNKYNSIYFWQDDNSLSGDSNEAGDELPIELRHLEDRCSVNSHCHLC